MADYRDIDFYQTEKGNVNIMYSLSFALHEARVAASIDADTWNNLPGTPMWMTSNDEFSKCHVLIWWKYRNKIEAVQQSANIRANRRKGKHGS